MFAANYRTAPIPIYTKRTLPEPTHARFCEDVKSPRSTVNQLPDSPPMSICELDDSSFVLKAVEEFPEIVPNVRGMSARQLAVALEKLSTVQLPDAASMFPWLHGVPASNVDQMDFFRMTTEPLAPTNYRGITLVHATAGFDGHLGRLRGSVLARDILAAPGISGESTFIQQCSKRGISLRNFRTQSAQIALLSDIVIYDHNRGDVDTDAALLLASRFAEAQRRFRIQQGTHFPEFHTFVVADKFATFERDFPHLVARTLDGRSTGNDTEFVTIEQFQMRNMSRATEISENVYLGNSHDWTNCDDSQNTSFDIHVVCDESVSLPSPDLVRKQIALLSEFNKEIVFVSSGCFGTPTAEQMEAVIIFCAWVYSQTHVDVVDELAELSETHITVDGERFPPSYQFQPHSRSNDSPTTDCLNNSKLRPKSAKRILISCKDGYTETSLLALLYTMYAHCITADEAWLSLHGDKQREFYTFPEDVEAVEAMMPGLIRASPHPATVRSEALARMPARWFTACRNGFTDQRLFTGSFPSRVLDHLYLGNLEHANNVPMLEALGIERVLSVGELPDYLCRKRSKHIKAPSMPLAYLYIKEIQDDGIDSLTKHLEQCLDFIQEGVDLGQATLVHCRVGVSRSASICIAEVVRKLRVSLEEAYLLVRVRRLNVIIQPNLKFMYELLKWSQEELSRQAGLPEGELVPRTIEWPVLASKIAELNKLYINR